MEALSEWLGAIDLEAPPRMQVISLIISLLGRFVEFTEPLLLSSIPYSNQKYEKAVVGFQVLM